MAVDVSKLKKTTRAKGLGSPPGPEEVAISLGASEVAPSPQPSVTPQVISEAPKPIERAPTEPYVRRDGRSARKTNRILPFATRVSAELDMDIRDIADREGLKLVEVLERAIVAYKEKMNY